MAQLPSPFISHSQRVCRLYKRCVRTLRDFYHDPAEWRYHAVLMRDRFDQNKDIKDVRLAKELLLKGEEEWKEKRHFQPFIFASSPGGTAYQRNAYIPDWVLDYWHPIEKAMYPKYFARREQRKKEYMEWYYRQFPDRKPKELEE